MLGKLLGRPFHRRDTKVPSNFKRVKRLNYYSFFNQMRLVFFTNKGTFYGPPFVEQMGKQGISPRQLKCPVLEEIEFDFKINNVLVFNFEYAEICRPEATFPIDVFGGEKIQFAFYFPFFIFPDGTQIDV